MAEEPRPAQSRGFRVVAPSYAGQARRLERPLDLFALLRQQPREDRHSAGPCGASDGREQGQQFAAQQVCHHEVEGARVLMDTCGGTQHTLECGRLSLQVVQDRM